MSRARRAVTAVALLAWGCSPTPAPTAQPTLEPLPTATPRPTPRLVGLPDVASGDVEADPVVGDLPGPPDAAEFAVVTRIVDGDTVVLRGIGVGKRDTSTDGRHARLIGVDTPEVHGGEECFGRQASAFTKAGLDGADVLVGFDVEATDRFGRALVYVWNLDQTFFNARLLREGYASQLTIPPNVRYADLFTALAREAREEGRGLWSACQDEPGAAATARSSDGSCHASYPDLCIPPPPPDLDCGDVEARRFTVRHDVPDPDPHRFDGNRDGVGCET